MVQLTHTSLINQQGYVCVWGIYYFLIFFLIFQILCLAHSSTRAPHPFITETYQFLKNCYKVWQHPGERERKMNSFGGTEAVDTSQVETKERVTSGQ